MHIVILGAPGAGKGTQAKFIMEQYSIPHISTGDILRAAIKTQSNIGKQAQVFMNIGKLVNDDLVISLVKERLKQKDCSNGFLLDGFPRNLTQANAIKEAGIMIDYVLELMVPDDVIVDRIEGRRIHLPSGRVYHIKFNPPKQYGKDDITGEALSNRKDDLKDTVRKRLLEYNQQITQLRDYYRKEFHLGNLHYYIIDGTRQVADINTELANIIC